MVIRVNKPVKSMQNQITYKKKIFLVGAILVAVFLISSCETRKEKAINKDVAQDSGSKVNAEKDQKENKYILKSGEYDFAVKHDGLERKYLVHIPVKYSNNTKTPLVIALHGGAGNAEDSPAFFHLNPKADQEGFILAYPEGTGKDLAGKHFGSWNAGRCCSSAKDENIDDVGFIREMIAKLKTDFNIDEKRIYATGFSNGAQMAFRLACEMSEEIAAVASGGSVGSYDACNPKRPVPIFFFHGIADTVSPYEGGSECGVAIADFLISMGLPAERNPFVCEGNEAYIAKWRKFNGCSDVSKLTFNNGNATCDTYDQCNDKAEITFCKVEGMGHIWPGPNADYGNVEVCNDRPNGVMCKGWKKTMGPLSGDLDANKMIWDFFKKHPLK